MFKRSKSIKELYRETSHFGLVITNDAALATGLNRLVEVPRAGMFALTPRQIASRYGVLFSEKICSSGEIVAALSERLKLPLRAVHPVVEKIIDVWRNTGLLDSCEIYLKRKEEIDVWKLMKEYPTIELMMEMFDEDFYDTGNIAVIGYELFNLLDRQVLPRKTPYAEIGLFHEGYDFPVEKTYIFPSSNDMINGVIDCICEENQNSSAIVINFASEYLGIIKSRLRQKGIGIIESSYLSQQSLTKDFINIISMSFMQDELLVSDVKQLNEIVSVNISNEYNQWLFDSFMESAKPEARLQAIQRIIKHVTKWKYSDLLNELNENLGVEFSNELHGVIELLGLGDAKITEDNFNELNYFIRYIDAEYDKSADGILFANSQNSVYINREIVFYLGMDASWTKLIGDKEYIDKVEEEKKNLEKFQILLSQGSQRFYLTHAVINGQKTIPCHYFNLLVDRKIDSFESPHFSGVNPHLKPIEYASFEKKYNNDLSHKEITEISQSKLNSFYACPRRYAYDHLITTPENIYLQRGTILHCFAEFCFDYTEFCTKNFDKILKLLLDKIESFSKSDEGSEESTLKIAMLQIIRFISQLEFPKTEFEGRPPKDNFLYKEFNKPKLHANTEFYFSMPKQKIKGRVDLQLGNGIYDYKISTKKYASSYVNNSVLSILRKNKSGNGNFQTPMYFLYLKTLLPDADNLKFAYLFPIANPADVINSKDTVMPESLIYFKPVNYIDYLCGEEFYEMVSGKSEAANRIGYQRWKEFVLEFEDKLITGDDIQAELEKRFYDIIVNEFKLGYKDFGRRKEEAFVKNEIVSVASAFKKIRTPYRKPGIIFKDDVKDFEDYISEVIAEIREFRNTDFPYRPAYDKRKVCYNCSYLGICSGNRLWEGTETVDNNNNEEKD